MPSDRGSAAADPVDLPDPLEQATRDSGVHWQMRSDPWVPGLTVAWHPDVERIGDRVALAPLASGRDVPVSRLEPLLAAPSGTPRRPLAEPHLSRTPLRILAAGGGALRLARGDCATAIEVGGVSLGDERTISGDELARGVTLLLAERVLLVLHCIDPGPARDLPPFGLVGESRELDRLRRRVAGVVGLDVPVLVRGESGSGKELVAQAIHTHGRRAQGPFVSVNMGAVTPSLAAAELFGAARGAFTGSERTQEGCFRRAHGGTLFLDEVGEMPAEVQAMLLRVLETGEVRSLGEDAVRRVDVRVVAATDTDLEVAVEEGRFRAPLLHRLNGYEIAVPPLRARRDDVGRLLLAFLRQELEAVGGLDRLEPPREGDSPWLPASLVERLVRVDWPGNVRQLKNACRELALLGHRLPQVELGPQVERLLADQPAAPEGDEAPAVGFRSPGEIAPDELRAALATHRWRLKPAAEQLGISRPSLYDLIRAHPRLRTAADLPREELEEGWQATGGDVEAMADALEVSVAGLRRRLRKLDLV